MDEEDTNDKPQFSPEEEEKLKQIFGNLLRGKSLYFKLDENKKVVPCSMYEFAEQCENPASRIVGQTQLGPYHVSTVFLMLNYGFGGKDQFFETMIWSEKTEEEHRFFNYQTRYETYEEALEGHETVVIMVHEGFLP
jgi:hypothetical protein